MNTSLRMMIVMCWLALSGCGTSLVVRGGDRESLGSLPGVAVNTRRLYVGTVSFPAVTKRKAPILLRGASVDQVTYVSTRRMPFASGKLTLELDPNQLVKKVGITSDSGLPRSLNSATQIVEFRNAARSADDDSDDSSTP